LVKVRLHLIDFCPLSVDHRKYQPKGTRRWYAIVTTTHDFVTHPVCLDDHYDDDDDYQEVNAVPPESVLDVYRHTTTFGDTGSRGLNVLDQLIA